MHLIVLGKLKESYWREAETEYLKRLRPYVRCTIVELREESFSEKDVRERVKEKEAEKIINALTAHEDAYIIALDEHGTHFSSVDFSRKLSAWAHEHRTIIFIMGGPLGLSPAIVTRAHTTVSLSHFTFTHQMARVILLEQIYRSMMIRAGRSYHY